MMSNVIIDCGTVFLFLSLPNISISHENFVFFFAAAFQML